MRKDQGIREEKRDINKARSDWRKQIEQTYEKDRRW